MKEFYYPSLNGSKQQLFDEGYIAAKSGHSRGSTIDLTIIAINDLVKSPVEISHRLLADGVTVIPFLDDNTVDMGSSFDLLEEVSHHDTPLLTDIRYTQNRQILKDAMMKGGFKPLHEEWWHYTLIGEPYPNTYFDFVNTLTLFPFDSVM